MPTLAVRPSRDLRNHYSEIRDMLHEHQRVIITNRGQGDAVLMSLDDYNAIEQRFEAEDKAWVNAKLQEAEIEAAKPNAKWYDAHELLADMDKKYGFKN